MLPLVFTMMLLPLDCPCTAAPPSIWMYPSFPVLLEETSSFLRGGTVVMERPANRAPPGFSCGGGALPDRCDLVPPAIVDGLPGEDLGFAAAQLIAAHSWSPSGPAGKAQPSS